MTTTSRVALAAWIGVCAIACGVSSEAPATEPQVAEPQAAPQPSATAPEEIAIAPTADVLGEICPDVSARAPGTHADALAIVEVMFATHDAEAARALVCRAGTTERAFALGVFQVASHVLREGDRGKSQDLIRASVATYAEPFALGRLAEWHLHGVEGNGTETIERDLGAAFCEARAAASIIGSLVRQNGEDALARLAWILASATLAAFGDGTPTRDEYDLVAHAVEDLECISQHRSRFEARFGALPLDPGLVRERQRAGLPPVP